MRILVTFALEAEFAPWRRLRPFRKTEAGRLPVYTAQIASADVVAVLTGVGPSVAAGKVEAIFRAEDFDVCISSGLAGALRPSHLPGEVLAARRVGAASGARSVDGDAELLSLAAKCGAKIVPAFHSGERVLRTASEKSGLASQADAVEMESREILAGAVARGARAVAVRAIADGADEDLPLDFNRVLTPVGQLSLLRVCVEAAKRPGELPALVRFGRQGRWAAERLGAFLDRYVEAVAVLMEQAAPITRAVAG